jgi:hypothetical protein
LEIGASSASAGVTYSGKALFPLLSYFFIYRVIFPASFILLALRRKAGVHKLVLQQEDSRFSNPDFKRETPLGVI